MNRTVTLLALALAGLDWTCYITAGKLMMGQAVADWEKAQVFVLLWADAYVVLATLALLHSWRSSRVWVSAGVIYLVFRSMDRVSMSRCDMHLLEIAKYGLLLWDDPQSLQWLGGTQTILAPLGRAAVYAAGLLLLAKYCRWTKAPTIATILTIVAALLLPFACSRPICQAASTHLLVLPLPRVNRKIVPAALAAQNDVEKAFLQTMEAPSRAQVPAKFKPRNLLIVIGESWNAAIVPELCEELKPYLKAGFVSPLHYSSSNSSTLGLYSILSGRDALFAQGDLRNRRTLLLPDALKQLGYQTHFWGSAAFWAADGQALLLANSHFDEVSMGQGIPNERTDQRLFERAREVLQRPGPPQCVIVFTGLTHFPYQGEASTSGLPNPSERYRGCLRKSLHQIASLLQTVDLSQTVVVVVGDHGESMGEDGSFSHITKASNAQSQTSLWMLGPAVPGPLPLTRHVDLAPTILHALVARPVACSGVHGRDLFEHAAEVAVVTPFSRFGEPQQPVLFSAGRCLRLLRPDPLGSTLLLDAVCDPVTASVLSRDIDESWLASLRQVESSWLGRAP